MKKKFSYLIGRTFLAIIILLLLDGLSAITRCPGPDFMDSSILLGHH